MQERVIYCMKIVIDNIANCHDAHIKSKTDLPWRHQPLMAETCNIGKEYKMFMVPTTLRS